MHIRQHIPKQKITNQASTLLSTGLGNVMLKISDKRLPQCSATVLTGHTAYVISATDYSAFGAPLPGRTFAGEGYRFGFNGKEKDDETYGTGNEYDYGFRIYNPRLGKFLSVDPLTKDYPWYTPYQFAGNKPIWAIDLDGLEEVYYTNAIKNNGFNNSLKLLEKAGVKDELEKQFAINNNKFDIHFVVKKTGAIYDKETGDFTLNAKGFTTMRFTTTEYGKSMEEKKLLLYDLRQELPKDNLKDMVNTLNKNKDIILVVISEELVNQINVNPEISKVGAEVIAHEFGLHGIDKKNFINENQNSRHQWYYNDKKLSENNSPAYKDIKINSKAGLIKHKIEKAYEKK